MRTLFSIIFFCACSTRLFAMEFEVREVGDGSVEIVAFHGTETRVDVPAELDGKRVISIGEWAFFGNETLREISLPNGLSEIGVGAFAHCTALENAVFPQALRKISDRAFFGCVKLSAIVLPKSVGEIGTEAFALCKGVRSVVAPRIIAKMGRDAFPKNASALLSAQNPPILELVSGTLKFSDTSGDSVIDGNEKCTLSLAVKNVGKGDAYGCRLCFVSAKREDALKFPRAIGIPRLRAGETLPLEIPIVATRELSTGTAEFSLLVEEPHGFGTPEHELVLSTRAFSAPALRIVDSAVSVSGGGTLQKNHPFTLQIFLQNMSRGLAEDVAVRMEFPPDVVVLEGEEDIRIGRLAGGEAKSLDFTLFVPRRFGGDEIPVRATLSEKYGEYAENWSTTLKLNSAVASAKTVFSAKDLGEDSQEKIVRASFSSAVDKDIPENPEERSRKIFVAIVANENYAYVAPVDFAVNDGEQFYAYCRKTLGVPASQVKLYKNATSGNLLNALSWLVQRGQYVPGAELVFYYSGHGVPDDATRRAYLLPTDISPENLRFAEPLALDSFYKTLSASGAKLVTVFLDACFSGMRRDSRPIVAAKAVSRDVPVGLSADVPPNLVVFAAASGDQTAGFSKEEKHGLFTYVLLKKLQDSKGRVSLGELRDYLRVSVPEKSVLIGEKPQVPSVIANEKFPFWEQKLYSGAVEK